MIKHGQIKKAKSREDKTNFSLSTMFRHRIWCITINTEYKNLQKKNMNL